MSTAGDPAPGLDPVGRVLLGLAALAVAFAAADTYVVVLALPEMMSGAGLSAEDLQRAAPIVSGFLLGYVGALPLVGRIVDLRGRVPVLVGSLVVFALGSLVTASSYNLASMVAGRVLQGIGGGGLLPATLSLVAAMYPPQRRGLPLGVVGAVQEFGNVVGPLYGAVVLAFGTWRDIFWINLAAGLVLAAVVRVRVQVRPGTSAAPDPAPAPDRAAPQRRARPRFDVLGTMLAAGALAALVLVMRAPRGLTEDVTLGRLFLPHLGGSRWSSVVALSGAALMVLFVLRCFTAVAPLVDLRAWTRTAKRIDLLGVALLSLSLGGLIVAFSTADPQVRVFDSSGYWLLTGSALTGAGFWWRNRSVANPLIPSGSLARVPAWGSLAVSFFIGAGLIAALVDIPIFARLTVYGDSQVLAALVLVRFLVGLPIGAFLGGWWTRRMAAGPVTAVGMILSAVGFAAMSRWGLESLRSPSATVPLLLAGLGIGLAMAPVNAALLATTESSVHGISSALLVVARSVGKLVGISALTTIGLRRYYTAQSKLPGPQDVCPDGRSRCPEFTRLFQETGLVQLHTIFVGAAVSCLLAGLVALVVFRGAPTRAVDTPAFGAHFG